MATSPEILVKFLTIFQISNIENKEKRGGMGMVGKILTRQFKSTRSVSPLSHFPCLNGYSIWLKCYE